MDSAFLLLLGLTSVGVILGILIGRLTARREQAKLMQDAFERGRAESEVEKANLAVEIGDQMLKLRSGIQDLARAYEGTARIVRDRLLGSVDHTISVPSETQLSLNFHNGELRNDGDLLVKTGETAALTEEQDLGHGQGLSEEIDVESISPRSSAETLEREEIVSRGIDDETILDDESRLKEKFVSNLI